MNSKEFWQEKEAVVGCFRDSWGFVGIPFSFVISSSWELGDIRGESWVAGGVDWIWQENVQVKCAVDLYWVYRVVIVVWFTSGFFILLWNMFLVPVFLSLSAETNYFCIYCSLLCVIFVLWFLIYADVTVLWNVTWCIYSSSFTSCF